MPQKVQCQVLIVFSVQTCKLFINECHEEQDYSFFQLPASSSRGNVFVSRAVGLSFKFRASQIGHSVQCCQRLATAATFLQKEL